MSAQPQRPSSGEPIAVVGMACRLPGADSPDAFWRLLSEAREAVADAPADRRPDGGVRGGFLADVDRFDAAFFGISPAEAAAMDPQQRLVLELAWEALEHARIVPDTLRGGTAAVLVGAITGDYALLHDRLAGAGTANGAGATPGSGAAAGSGAPAGSVHGPGSGSASGGRHDVAGTHRSMIANRVSHLLGLHGPSLTVDSGQSSSLVAVQLACEELRRGTASLALAGGVNLNLLAETDAALRRFGALSPDGRCHTFDSRANGYVRGEGGGLVVLKPLSSALADGDTVHGVILGGAVNSGTGAHLTVPDAGAQREVVEQACRAAGVMPGDVAYVELHGTGTAVGDPVEAAALGAALGAARTAAGAGPLLVGSAKTNVGHLEGAAGIVGLLKVVLALRNGTVPPSLHFTTPNPGIPLAELGLRVAAESSPWPGPQAVAGVSAFGMGGANCHLLLGPGPSRADDASGTGKASGASDATKTPGTASTSDAANSTGASDASRTAGATGTSDAANSTGAADSSRTPDTAGTPDAASLPSTADTSRTPDTARSSSAADSGSSRPGSGDRRAIAWVLSGRSAAALRGQAARLGAWVGERPHLAAGDVAVSLLRTRARFEHRAVVLGTGRAELTAGLAELAAGRFAHGVVAGQVQSGRRVFVFPGPDAGLPYAARELLDESGPFAERFAACAAALAPHLGYDLVQALRDADGPDRDGMALPVQWATAVAFAEVWRARGVEPEAVLAGSYGEIAAATVIDALDLDDAARIAAAAGRSSAAVGGGMLAVAAPVQAVEERIAGLDAVCVSGVDGPCDTVVSGPADELAVLAAAFAADGVDTAALPVRCALGSPALEQIRGELLDAVGRFSPRASDVPLYSATSGGRLDPLDLDAGHWWSSLRSTAQFAAATRAALADGAALFVPCGPQSAQAAAIGRTADDAGYDAAVVGALRPAGNGRPAVLRALAEAYAHGVDVDLTPEAAPADARPTDLPTYAFQRERHWLNDAPVRRTGDAHPAPKPAPGPGPGPVPAPAPAPVSAKQSAAARPAVTGLPGLVAAATAAVLGHPDPAALDLGRSFTDLGLDSFGTVDLCEELSDATGLRLPSTLLFEHPSPKRVAAHLAQLIAAAPEAAARVAARSAGSPATTPAAPAVPTATATPDASRTAVPARIARAQLPSVARTVAADADKAAARDRDDDVAIVAMSCRYPGGVGTPEELWDLVASGTDATSALPADRGWDLDALLGDGPQRPGACATTGGGFLHDAPWFDAAFFGLSPREAVAMDPQQRLLLETSWEALERAGIDPASLDGRPVGVFVGAMASDYGPRLHRPGGGADGHLLTGTASSVASGRIAYVLGLRGPALTVDTACSSSLVAVHLAVRALRRGECPLALAAGVTVMSTPGMLMEFSRQGGLAPDGRAKAFSADANGTAFAEGAGVLLLERLGDARRNGHPVLAVIRGTAVNQDGASNGLTAPDGGAQREVVRLALADAGLAAGEVDAIEAHGTGTRLGDPVEANALIATYGRPADGAEPVWLGSVKSNIGHTQAAAGVAGVIKMVQAMRHELLPATLHAERPTPRADWDAGRVRLLGEARPWPRGCRPRRAAVSSFGISGTNAHLVIEECDPADAATHGHGTGVEVDEGTTTAWVVSARSAASLRAQAGRLAAATGAPRAADTARTLAGRSVFAHRAVVLGAGREELRAGLAALADGAEAAAGLVTGTARRGARTAVLFTGQGAQRPGMGHGLYEAFPAFAAAFDAACAALDPYLERPLREIAWAGAGSAQAALLDRTRYAQPALFAYETAAWELLRSLGVEAEVVAGHSVGEFAAAYAAGVWSLDDAARLVAARGRLMDELPADGAMFAVAAGEDEVRATLAGREHEVDLAAVNGPRSVVVSGTAAACREIAALWSERGCRTKQLTVSHAFHSPLMEPVLDAFRREAVSVAYAPPQTAYEPAARSDRDWTDPEYWVEQIRAAVLFAPMVDRLLDAGVDVLLEAGPQPHLAGMARECAAARTAPSNRPDAPAADGTSTPDGTAAGTAPASAGTSSGAGVVAIARRGRDERATLLRGLAEAFAAGVPVDWAAAVTGGVRTDLPTYAFDRRRFWLTDPADGGAALPQRTTEVARDGGLLLDGRFALRSTPWLADHVIAGRTILPGTAFAELAVQAAAAAGAPGVASLTLTAPLALPDRGAVEVQVAVGGEDARGQRELTVHARPAERSAARPADETADGWTVHATGRTAAAPAAADPTAWAASWPPAGAEPIAPDGVYPALAAAGYGYGPAFRGLAGAWRSGADLYAEVRLPAAATGEHTLHPALLDAVLHVLLLEREPDTRPVPFAFTDTEVAAAGATALRVRISPEGAAYRLTLCDAAGRFVGRTTVALRNAPDGFGLPDPATADRPGPVPQKPAPEPVAVPHEPAAEPVAVSHEPAPEPAHGPTAGPLPRTTVPEPRSGPHEPAGAPQSVLPGGVSALDLVREHAAAVLGHDQPDAIELDQPFTELGFDSLASVEFQLRLEEETGLTLASTLVFDHPTVADVAAHLRAMLAPAVEEPPVEDDGLDELRAALEAVADLAAAAADSPARQTAATLLDRTLHRLRDDRTAPDLHADLGLVTDEDLFAFIDTHL